MPYVNIPVPEEHVEEVMQFVIRTIARASIEPWDEASITEFFGSTDESSRALMAFVARSSLAGNELPEAELAANIQLNWREVFGIIRDLNEQATRLDRPSVITARIVTERLANGRDAEKRVYSMTPEVAPLIEAADRADLMSDTVASGEGAPTS